MEETLFMGAMSNIQQITLSGRKRIFMQANPKKRSKEQMESMNKLSWMTTAGMVEVHGKDKRKSPVRNLIFLRQEGRPPANLADK